MIRKLGILVILASLLVAAVPVGDAAAQEEMGAVREAPAVRPAANVPFLFSAFALTWIVLWVYLVHVHRGQRRLEKMLGALGEENRVG